MLSLYLQNLEDQFELPYYNIVQLTNLFMSWKTSTHGCLAKRLLLFLPLAWSNLLIGDISFLFLFTWSFFSNVYAHFDILIIMTYTEANEKRHEYGRVIVRILCGAKNSVGRRGLLVWGGCLFAILFFFFSWVSLERIGRGEKLSNIPLALIIGI